MAIFSSLRSRRSLNAPAEKTRPLLAFPLGPCWFALAVEAVAKVVPLGALYGDPQDTGICLTCYQGRELLALDVGHLIFGESLKGDGSDRQGYLIVLQGEAADLAGLPVSSQPAVRRIPESAFVPIPETYMAAGNIRCISTTMIQLPQQPPLFWLDPHQLLGKLYLQFGTTQPEGRGENCDRGCESFL